MSAYILCPIPTILKKPNTHFQSKHNQFSFFASFLIIIIEKNHFDSLNDKLVT